MYAALFWSFVQIGLFSIGGGYASLPLIREQVVDIHGWLTAAQLTDIITISQMTPGPIAINTATFIGIRLGGLPGAVIATGGCVLPSCVIVMTLASLYTKYKNLGLLRGILTGLRPAVVALIAGAGVSILTSALFPEGIARGADEIALGIFAVCLFLLRRQKPDPIRVMILAGVLGVILYPLLGA